MMNSSINGRPAISACQQAQQERASKKLAEKLALEEKERARLAAISAFLGVTIKGMERFEKIFDEERLTIVGDGGTCQVKSSHSDASCSTAMIFSLASNTDIRGGAARQSQAQYRLGLRAIPAWLQGRPETGLADLRTGCEPVSVRAVYPCLRVYRQIHARQMMGRVVCKDGFQGG